MPHGSLLDCEPETNLVLASSAQAIMGVERVAEMTFKTHEGALATKKARGAQLSIPQDFMMAVVAQEQVARQHNAREYQANQLAVQLAELLQTREQALWQIAAKLNGAGYRARWERSFIAPLDRAG